MCLTCKHDRKLCPICTEEMTYAPADVDGAGRAFPAGYGCPSCGHVELDAAELDRIQVRRGEEGFGPLAGDVNDGSPSMLPLRDLPLVAIGPRGYTVDWKGRPVAGPLG